MKELCRAAVYRQDTHRYTGRGSRGGFQMHYTRRQCSRAAKEGELCGQHARIEAAGAWVERMGSERLR